MSISTGAFTAGPRRTLPTIEVSSVTCTFGAVPALEDLSFQAFSGRVTALMGLEGSGKTTALRLLLGVAEPQEGTVIIGGRPGEPGGDPRAGVGTVPLLEPWEHGLSGRDHLLHRSVATGDRERHVENLLTRAGLEEVASVDVARYSADERRRLALCMALAGEPRILLIDDVFRDLEPASRTWTARALRRFAGDGGTVLLTSDVSSPIGTLVDDVVVLSHGRSVFVGTVDRLRHLTGERDLHLACAAMVR